jgi:hypothetical protein
MTSDHIEMYSLEFYLLFLPTTPSQVDRDARKEERDKKRKRQQEKRKAASLVKPPPAPFDPTARRTLDKKDQPNASSEVRAAGLGESERDTEPKNNLIP